MSGNVFAIGNTNADIVNIGGNADEINLGGAGTDLNLGTSGGQTDVAGDLNVIGNLKLTVNSIKTINGDDVLIWQDIPASISIPGNLDTNGNLGVDGNSVIAGTLTVGNLVVTGSSTVTSIANLLVKDKLIVVAKDSADPAATDGAGLQVDVSLASITYEHATNSWVMNKNLRLGTGTFTTSGVVTTGRISTTGNITATGRVTGATLSGNLVTAAQGNITSVGTLTSLLVSGNIQSNSTVITSNITSTGTLNITAATDRDINILPSGTGQVDFTGAIVVSPQLRNYSETVVNFGDLSGNFTPNFSTGAVKRFRATGTINLQPPTNFPVGGSMTIIIEQDGTGARLLNPDSSFKWGAGNKILSTAPGAVDVINIFYDGVNYLCALSKGYV